MNKVTCDWADVRPYAPFHVKTSKTNFENIKCIDLFLEKQLFDCYLDSQYIQLSLLHWVSSIDTEIRGVRYWIIFLFHFIYFIFLWAGLTGSQQRMEMSFSSLHSLCFLFMQFPLLYWLRHSKLHKRRRKKNWGIIIICVCVEAGSVVVFDV